MEYINDSMGKNIRKKSIEKQLMEQASYLQKLIVKHMTEYRGSFNPKVYKRNGSLMNSVSVSSKIKYENGMATVYVYFNENALHRSGYGVWAVRDGRGKYDDDIQNFSSKKSANTALLLNYGYTVKKPVWFAEKENLGYRAGAYFVEKAIEEFNATNPIGIKIDNKRDILQYREW